MLNFRQKIFLTYLLVFMMFLALMSPIASALVHRVVETAMENRAREVIAKIQSAPTNEVMIRKLKELKPLTFFRISVINNERKVLYDSHTKRLIGPRFSQEHVVNHPEVIQAFETGHGYAEDYSDLLEQKFAYTAVAFDFHGKKYVLRTAFPYRYLKELINDFEIGFLVLASLILILFSMMTWFIIYYLTKPIQEIITSVASYKEDERNPLPGLRLISTKMGGGDDIGKLAQTLISLSERLQKQISTLREERNEKEVLLESLVEGVIATDRDLDITFANVSAQKFLGLQKEDLMGKPVHTIKQDKIYGILMTSQKEERPVVDNLRIETPTQVYFLDIVAVPKRDNTGAILVILDKSDHYKILEMRKDFIANASHELKTPITIIRGFAETLYDNPELEKELSHEILGKIVRNCERMATLVRDLLALADIENIPSYRMIDFDLIPLINKISQMIQEVFPDAQIHLVNHGDEPVFIEADIELVEMAISNLLQNAAKYSKPPADITVDISHTEENVTIKISDKGIGIPQQDISRIFERFFRVDKAHSRKVGGSGLGLSIVDTVIRKHFGKISVESELGVGTTFTIVLPTKHIHVEEVKQ